MVNGKIIDKALCDIGAHISVISSKVYDKLFSKTLQLAPTPIQLIMGDGRTTEPLGVLRDLKVNISSKSIPTDLFIIDASYEKHDDIILSRHFLKLVDDVLDAREGKVIINVDGAKYTYDFLPASQKKLHLSPDNKEVESICFDENFRDPLLRAMENNVDGQDSELGEATDALSPQYRTLEEGNFEDIGELVQQEPEAPDVEQKPFPEGLKYEYLGNNKTYPVIVSNELNE
ncbi:uncharacterized protein [Setaria viridis]|uniref:uncharacterized protein n=1 Tax=Setaria viridis TaxID=4556 RepID=UPI003B3BB7F7